nr:immunoglobulin light chain junction region [Homo sapiens]
EDFAVYYCQ